MYGKPAITCFKYQVFLYGSEAINIFECYTLSGYRASSMSHHTAPTLHYRQLSPTLYGSITFTHLIENSCFKPILKRKGETCVVQEPSHVKQLFPICVCKIGLNLVPIW
jgi:hypothetical protein